MRRAIEAAREVRGQTSPNPWVGAVVVRNGEVISVGATAPPGGPHAEAAALANIDATGATLYTTLEPCMPFEGKRTRPCAEAIVEAGVARVVIALEDPHAPVRGQGAAFLRAHGITVETGDGAEDVTDLLRPYLKFRETGRPYLIAKFAVSLDGKVGAPAQDIRWLTGSAARERAHADRAWVDAILVGSGTVLADDPALTARRAGKLADRQPLRLVLDARGRIPASAGVLGKGAIVCTSSPDRPWRQAVAATGATIVELEPGAAGVNLEQLFRMLGQRSVMSVIAEGGPTLLASLFAEGHVDEVHAYVAPVILGPDALTLFGAEPSFDAATLRAVVIEPLAPDVLIRGYTGSWSPS
jgi:diaminohydroxyphosphoribosylaminopyrimidine deaminase/5-amino-6-(5-phosphoribosylamino)uracil reductase